MELLLLLFPFATTVLIGSLEAADPTNCPLPPRVPCPLFSNKSDRLSTQDLLQKEVNKGSWFMLFGSEFTEIQSYGKCVYRWNIVDEDNGILYRELMCYNFKLQKCESFTGNVIWKDDNCGQIVETGVNRTLDAWFHSQQPDQYLLYSSCYSYDESGTCTEEYLDIILRQDRLRGNLGEEVNLQYAPLHLMAVDLKNNFNMDFSSSQLFYYWKGPECNFDGTLVTNDSRRNAFNVVMFILASVVTLLR